MKKLVMFAVLSVFVLGASAAYAACTPEEAQQKAVQFTTQLQALAQKDPARAQELGQELAAKTQEMQAMTDMDQVCKFYDDLIEKTK